MKYLVKLVFRVALYQKYILPAKDFGMSNMFDVK